MRFLGWENEWKAVLLTEIRNMKRQHIFRGRMSSILGVPACFLEGHPGKARPGPGFVVLGEVMSMEKMPKGMGGMSL